MDITISRHDRDLAPAAADVDTPARDKRKRDSGYADWYPDQVNRRYVIVGSNLFRDRDGKDLALRDTGDRLEAAKPASRDTIADMVAIAAHRGWHRIAVEGDRDGRREAWLQARLHGLEVTGYEATKVDLAVLEKAGGVGARARTEPAPAAPVVEVARAYVRPIGPPPAPSRVPADGAPEAVPTLSRVAAPVVPLRARDDRLGTSSPTHTLPAPPPWASSFAPAASGSPPLAAASSPSWQPNPALLSALGQPSPQEPVVPHDCLDTVKAATLPTPQVPPAAEPTRDGERRAQLFAMAETSMTHREQAIRDPAVRAAIAHMVVIEKVVKTTVANPTEQRRVINDAWKRMGDFLSKGGVPLEPKVEAQRTASRAPGTPAKAPEPAREPIRERTHERGRGR